MWISVLVGMAFPMVIEFLGLGVGGNAVGPDYMDALVGPGISGLLVGGSWEFINFLSDSETHLRVEAMKNKFDSWTVGLGTMLEDQVHLVADGQNRGRVERALEQIVTDVDTHMQKATSKLEKFALADIPILLDPAKLSDRVMAAIEELFGQDKKV